MENKKQEEFDSIYTDFTHLIASLLTMGLSEDIEDWKLHKSTGVKDRRKIIDKAEHVNEKNRDLARKLVVIKDRLLKNHKKDANIF
jgi:hypothetical protein